MRASWNLGIHFLVELYDCNPAILKSVKEVRDAMVSAVKEAKATISYIFFHEFNPFGISGVVIIAEGYHLTIHTWPEYSYAAVTIFTSSYVTNPELAAAYLVKQFECKNPSVVEMKSGILYHVGCKLFTKQ